MAPVQPSLPLTALTARHCPGGQVPIIDICSEQQQSSGPRRHGPQSGHGNCPAASRNLDSDFYRPPAFRCKR